MKNNEQIKSERKLYPNAFVRLKFLFTLSSVLFFVVILISSIKVFKKTEMSIDVYIKVTFIILFFAIVGTVFYVFFRNTLHKKTNYIYNKKEKIFLISFYTTIIIILFLTVIYLIISIIYYESLIGNYKLFFPFIVFLLLFEIIGSFLEQQNRINEQVKIYNDYYDNNDIDKADKKIELHNQNKKIKVMTKDIQKKVFDKSDNPFLEDLEDD